MGLITNLVDIIYPPRCPICGEFLREDQKTRENRGVSFCDTCLADFRKITSPLCPVCSMPFASEVEEDHLCEDCLRKRPFYEATGAPYFYEGPLMEAIHRFKYGEKSYLSDSLGSLLAEYAENWLNDPGGFLTMPVPLHAKRLRERGFNQSLLLARHVAGRLHTELDFLSLKRVRYTTPQTGLGRDERRKNVQRAFQIVNPGVVEGRTALLVDDVFTTGNTLNECARALRKSGCKKVLCLVLARAGGF